jgi:ferredoxin--NADP+ reductase
MYKIVEKEYLNPTVVKIVVEAPRIAKKALPGQFIILKIDEQGERVPFTVADFDRENGLVTVIFQIVGATTKKLAELSAGEYILDFAGPLGQPTEVGQVKRVAVIGGGLGCAIALPQAKALHERGVDVDIIAGFKTRDLVILEKEMTEASTRLILTTDDGSVGRSGLVTQVLKDEVEAGAEYDLVIAIGPVIMMKFVEKLTRELGLPLIVSLNPIMIDGTGMCGGCRVRVGGEIKFACVDGPDFDGHLVDFDELMARNRTYTEAERHASENHKCRIGRTDK